VCHDGKPTIVTKIHKTLQKQEPNAMTTKFTITEIPLPGKPGKKGQVDLGYDHWVRGTIGEYLYDAKIYPCGSKYGIREGNISKLSIRLAATRKEVAAFDRGWDILPENEHIQEMVDALVEHYWA
jgi:hypothetical protein